MLFSASTVKDTLPNIERFVAGNLAGGVDHLVVFLDADQPDVRAWLDAHPHVTCVRTDHSWWRGDRPAELNVRQRINANVVKAVLTRCEWAQWVFHIDADEILQVDRDVLAGLPAGERVVRLAPLEAVSQVHWDGDPTLFKRLLDPSELQDLRARGVIDRAHNGAYFHGHVDGKSGLRPTLDLWHTLHFGEEADGTKLGAFRDGLSVLHFESYSGEDFVRKWTSILSSGSTPNFRPARQRTAEAIRALLDQGLSAQERQRGLMDIFCTTIEDPIDTLQDRGLLVAADWRRGDHVPIEFPDGGREQLEAVIDRIVAAPKRPFHPYGSPGEVERILDGGSGGRLRAARSFLRRT